MARSRNEAFDIPIGPPPAIRRCDQPGCGSEGLFRAPRSRDSLGQLNAYHWFCLDHVRLYNASWNYYAGMNEAEVESTVRSDQVGNRPSWPLGWRVGTRLWRDPLGVYGDPSAASRPARRPKRPSDEVEALSVLGLQTPFALEVLKARYKILVKRHHPDANGGSKEAEEQFKLITRAYALLKSRYFG